MEWVFTDEDFHFYNYVVIISKAKKLLGSFF